MEAFDKANERASQEMGIEYEYLKKQFLDRLGGAVKLRCFECGRARALNIPRSRMGISASFLGKTTLEPSLPIRTCRTMSCR